VAIRPKDLRLRREADIRALFRSGASVSEPPFKVFFRRTEHDHPRYGVQVSRRTSKKAVTRNRIRRRAREAFRAPVAACGQGVDLMVLAGPEAATLPWPQMLARSRRLLEQVRRRLDRAEGERTGRTGAAADPPGEQRT
jgi:ribonuclease P protein component